MSYPSYLEVFAVAVGEFIKLLADVFVGYDGDVVGDYLVEYLF